MTGAGDAQRAASGLKAALQEWLSTPGARTRLLLVAAILLLAIGAFSLGQWRAGYGAGDGRDLRARLSVLEQENREAREQVARLQTDARIDRETYTQVEQQLAELQGKIIEQQEELAFYRGVVAGPGKGGLRVQDLSLQTLPSAAVRLHFVIARVEGAGGSVRGEVQVRLEGMRAGRLVSMDLSTVAEAKDQAPLTFDLRYFQDLETRIRLPAGFTPQRVVIRIVPRTGGLKPSVESFPWSPRPS